VDVGGLWRGELSPRRAAVLLAHLPVGSAVWAAQAKVPYGWSLKEILLADLFHALTGDAHPLHPSGGVEAQATKRAESIERLQAQQVRLAARKAAESP
jgi:hypothetical protein